MSNTIKTFSVEIDGYDNEEVDIYLSDIFDEITDDELIDELERRGLSYKESDEGHFFLRKLYFTTDELYRHLCDICDCAYHEPKDSLLNKLKDMI